MLYGLGTDYNRYSKPASHDHLQKIITNEHQRIKPTLRRWAEAVEQQSLIVPHDGEVREAPIHLNYRNLHYPQRW